MDSTPSVSFALIVVVTVVGLMLIPFLVLLPNQGYFEFSARRTLVGASYCVICVLGIAATFYPTKCKGMFQRIQNPLSQAKKDAGSVRMNGHHPDCQKFGGNRIRIGNRAFCAACSGLLIGAVISFIGAALQFFMGLSLLLGSVWLLALGEIWMALGLAQIKFAGYAKVVANLIFVVGSFVTLVETDVLGSSLLVDIYVLGLISFLLWLRILLSERNNRRICRVCGSCL